MAGSSGQHLVSSLVMNSHQMFIIVSIVSLSQCTISPNYLCSYHHFFNNKTTFILLCIYYLVKAGMQESLSTKCFVEGPLQKIETIRCRGFLVTGNQSQGELQFLLSHTIGGTVSQGLSSILLFSAAFSCSWQHPVPTVTTACSRYKVVTGVIPPRQ